jgi:hypothetical protein
MNRKQIIKSYKAYFGLEDMPFRKLGNGDKACIEWAEHLVKNCSIPDFVGRSEQLVCDRVNRYDNNRCIN